MDETLTIDELRKAIPDTTLDIAEVVNDIDWRMFLLFWGFKGETLQQLLVNPEAEKTLKEGQQWLNQALQEERLSLKLLLDFALVTKAGNDLLFTDGQVMPMLRSQSATGHYRCLADYFSEQPKPLGMFTIVARPKQPFADEFADEAERLMAHAICARLTEAAAEWLQRKVYGTRRVIRAAFGYASCPDHSLKRIVMDRLNAEQRLDITLNSHYAIEPSTAICGLFIAHSEARFFPVGRIDRTQLEDYCQRRGISMT